MRSSMKPALYWDFISTDAESFFYRNAFLTDDETKQAAPRFQVIQALIASSQSKFEK